MAKPRRLTQRQQSLAENAVRFVQPSVAAFVRKNPDLRTWIRRVDLEGVAMQAICMAATTFDPTKSQPSTYFGSAIHHALYRAVFKQRKIDTRYVPVSEMRDPVPNQSRVRLEARAMRALKMLSAEDRTLLEDRLIEKVTLVQLGYEQGCDPRTVAKRVAAAIEKLRLAECDLP